MSNPSITSKLMTLVKGIFEQKKTPTAASPAQEATDTRSEGQTPVESAGDRSAGSETSTKTPMQLEAEEQAAVAEELVVAEADTQASGDEALKQTRENAAPSVEELPVPGYDELTLPSVRARLRKLTLEQVRQLRAYEVAHQGRQEFVRMYDNRIAKIQSESQ